MIVIKQSWKVLTINEKSWWFELRQFPAKIDTFLGSLIYVGKFHKKPFLTLTVGLSRHPIKQWSYLPIESKIIREPSGFKTEEP